MSRMFAQVIWGSSEVVQLGLETPNQQQLGWAGPGKLWQVEASLGKSVGTNSPILAWDTLGHYRTPTERRMQEITKPCGRYIKP